jgi:hypothetical protein
MRTSPSADTSKQKSKAMRSHVSVIRSIRSTVAASHAHLNMLEETNEPREPDEPALCLTRRLPGNLARSHRQTQIARAALRNPAIRAVGS